ncbi:MAG: chitobiase/beta-hexosaminidase C-terminal domain-containing protein [Cyanobacteria bacterium SZAS TMP-1]|nr:chitobiase/beta-hexosaminidase C-terminal domain-containing protein [Cyanobacteria bacterium SZAS TMP-1]
MPAAAVTVFPPVISPPNGPYWATSTNNVTITGDAGANFFYTTDGSTPTISSTPYTVPFSVTLPVTIKAIEVISGTVSSVSTANLYYDPSSLNVPRTGLVLWLKSDYGVNVTGSNVTSWTDISAGPITRTVSQSTTSAQPQYVANAINGLPAVSFNGTSQYLTFTDLGDLSKGVTIYAVVKPAGAGSATLFTTGTASSHDMAALLTSNTQGQFFAVKGTVSSNILSPTSSITPDAYQLYDVAHNGAASGTMSVNTIPVKTGTLQNFNASINRTLNFIGANNGLTVFWSGQLAELMVYTESGPGGTPVAVTASTRAQAQSYLSGKYQTATSVSTPAPVMSVAAGALAGPTQVAISAPANAVIRWTNDGTVPNLSSPIYQSPITVSYSQTIQAIAVANGVSSLPTSNAYTLDSFQYPAPASDSTPLQMNLQTPTVSIPQ